MNKIDNISPIVYEAKYGVLPHDWVFKEMVVLDFLLLYIKQGRVEVTIQGNKYIGEPGDIFFIRPKFKVAIRSISSVEVHKMYVYFDLMYSQKSQERHHDSLPESKGVTNNEISLFLEDLWQNSQWIPIHIRLSDPIHFESKIADIIHEFEQKITLFEFEVSAKVTMLLVYLWREFYWDEKKVDPNYEIILKVKEFLNENYMNDVTLDDLIDITFVSKFHLIQLFKEAYGTTPIQYHQKIRVKKSKELIRHTNYTLSEIAGKLGFESIHSFSRYFKKIDGRPPSFYRKKYKV